MFRFTDLIIFELTRDCNLRCKYCYQLEKDKYKGEIIDFSLYKKIINRIADQRIQNNRNNIPLQFNFHGGECTLVGYNNFQKYLEYLTQVFLEKKIRFRLGIQTNGSLLSQELLDLFHRYNVNIGVSFDGIEGNSKLRYQNKKLENFIYENINKAEKEGFLVGTLGVISQKNKKFIKKSLRKKNIYIRKCNYMEDMISPHKSTQELSGKEIFKYMFKPYIKNFLKTGEFLEDHVRDLLNHTLIDLLFSHKPSYTTGCNGKICGAGITMIAVRPDGTMGYCDRYSKDFSENYIEHALDYDFLGLHQLKKVVQLAKTKNIILKKHHCDFCKANFICEYGCLAFFYSKFGYYDIQEDLVCDQFRYFYSYIQRNVIKILKTYIKYNLTLNPWCEIYGINNQLGEKLLKNNIKILYSEEKQKIEIKNEQE